MVHVKWLFSAVFETNCIDMVLFTVHAWLW